MTKKDKDLMSLGDIDNVTHTYSKKIQIWTQQENNKSQKSGDRCNKKRKERRLSERGN